MARRPGMIRAYKKRQDRMSTAPLIARGASAGGLEPREDFRRQVPSSIPITSEGRVPTRFGPAGARVDTMSGLADWTADGIIHADPRSAITMGVVKVAREGRPCPRSEAVPLVSGPGFEAAAAARAGEP